jgi:ornithine cyclodeaminase/alanine dehydrogenase-like protein (mu-crystallin family)
MSKPHKTETILIPREVVESVLDMEKGLVVVEQAFPEEAGRIRRSPDPERCMAGADIIVTTTPSRTPVLRRGWIAASAHINAVGADAPGKQELDPEILAADRIAAHLGEVVCGSKPGRIDPGEITVFDSTGLAIHDIAAARFVYEECRQAEKGLRNRF